MSQPASAVTTTSPPTSPPVVLNREEIVEEMDLVAIRVPAQKCGTVMKALSEHLFKKPKLRSVLKADESDPDCSDRLVLLKETIPIPTNMEDLTGLPGAVRDFINNEKGEVQLTTYKLRLDYSYFSAEQVLKRLLPPNLDIPTSFETVGHVAHLNLRDDALPYKQIIAQVLLDKNSPRIRTVVNKTSTIKTKFRTFPLEVLAGETDLEVEMKESGAKFKFNFAEVYWNSRLQTEHGRVIKLIQPGQVVWDVFAGVGPFAVPLAMKSCQVYANDLNPRSYHYLGINATANKCKGRLEAFNLDGRSFIEEMCRREAPVHHLIMNLPNNALEFLDALRGRFLYLADKDLPTVHVYCFSKAKDPVKDAIQRASEVLGVDISGVVKAHQVRDVAPRKAMLCLSFPVPPAVNKLEPVVVVVADTPATGEGEVSDDEDDERVEEGQGGSGGGSGKRGEGPEGEKHESKRPKTA